MLLSVSEVQQLISTGKALLLAGSESALNQLPRGNWIGGTIPYFMDKEGGVFSADRIFVNQVPACALTTRIVQHTVDSLHNVCAEAPENGYSFLILPAGTPVHQCYAQNAPGYDGIFMKPVVGWVAGVALEDVGRVQPKVIDGRFNESFADRAVVMHVELPPGKVAELDILNVFQPGSGARIFFPTSSFTAGECTIDGKPGNIANYIETHKVDTRLPLTASYNGSVLNVAVQDVDAKNGTVRFFAPVFTGVEYRFAEPVEDYLEAFDAATRDDLEEPEFACNCVLNYVYGKLEGRKTGSITGPITFGEVAHQLLTQTLVRLKIRNVC